MSGKLSNDALLRVLSEPLEHGLISRVADVDPLFDALGRSFPTLGNSIDWKRVPRAISAGGLWLEDAAEKFSLFVAALVAKEKLTGSAHILCDSVDNAAFGGELDKLLPWLRFIAELGENTYVIPGPEVTWCAHLSFEGWMDFGFAPSGNQCGSPIADRDA